LPEELCVPEIEKTANRRAILAKLAEKKMRNNTRFLKKIRKNGEIFRQDFPYLFHKSLHKTNIIGKKSNLQCQKYLSNANLLQNEQPVAIKKLGISNEVHPADIPASKATDMCQPSYDRLALPLPEVSKCV
jgi:hypothetical protein